MFRKFLFLTLAAAAVTLVTSSQAQAWGGFHVGYTHVGAFGVQHYGRTVGVGPYGRVYSGGHYGAYGYGGGVYRAGYGYGDRYGLYGDYHYGGYPGYYYGGYPYYGDAYRAGVYRAW
jgi:hypothetical protein